MPFPRNLPGQGEGRSILRPPRISSARVCPASPPFFPETSFGAFRLTGAHAIPSAAPDQGKSALHRNSVGHSNGSGRIRAHDSLSILKKIDGNEYARWSIVSFGLFFNHFVPGSHGNKNGYQRIITINSFSEEMFIFLFRELRGWFFVTIVHLPPDGASSIVRNNSGIRTLPCGRNFSDSCANSRGSIRWKGRFPQRGGASIGRSGFSSGEKKSSQ
jgi:hypothetical protein